MPQQKQPITERSKDHDESTGNGTERHGKHREGDEGHPGSGSSKGGLNQEAGKTEERAKGAGGNQG